MSDIPRIWTQDFANSMVAAINSDAKFKKLAKGLTETIQLRCLDTPDGVDVAASYEVSNGQVTLAEWDERPAPAPFRSDKIDKRRFLARTTAPYPIWVKLDKGEMGVIDAVLSPHYVFEGAKLKVIKNIRVFKRISEIAQSIPSRYE